MPIFETNPIETYFGSYTDDYITGSMVEAYRTGGVLTVVTGARGKIASSIAGGNLLGNINQVGPYLRFSYLSQSQYIKSQRFVQLTNKNKQYHDSFIPEMSEIFKVDGVGPTLVRDYQTGDASVGYLYVYIFGTQLSNGISPASSSFLTSSADLNVSMSNNSWIASFPYQGKYRNVSRRLYPSKLEDIRFKQSASFANSLTVASILVAGTSSIERPANRSLDSFIDGNIFWSSTTTATVPQIFPIAGFLVTGSYDDRLQPGVPFSQSCLLLGVDFANNTTVNGNFNATTFRNIIGTDFVDSVKFFFGVGDRYKISNFLNVGWFVSGGPVRYIAGPHIRGWKYGMLSGLPAYPKHIFMRNRFGQMRHMLEQPKQSKFVDLSTGTVFQSPVKVTFLSSSIPWENSEYLTASNPVLNTRDSGFYDFEMKVGQPFSAS